jgi:aerotaxis receptor
MIDNVLRVSSLIKEIGLATQSKPGADAHQRLLSRIGAMTQSNTGMVDNVTHAANHLTQRTTRLQQAIAVFGG